MKKTLFALITVLVLLFAVHALATEYPAKGKTSYDSVNVRESASSSSRRVGKIYSGKTYTITGETSGSDGATWYAIEYETGSKGYVLSKYIKITEEAAPAVTPTPAADKPKATKKPKAVSEEEDEDEDEDEDDAEEDTAAFVVEEEVNDAMPLPDGSKQYTNWLKKTYCKKTVKVANHTRINLDDDGKPMRMIDRVDSYRFGMVGADIRDWDGDGQIEMLVMNWTNSKVSDTPFKLKDTITGRVTGEAGDCVGWKLTLFRYENKEMRELDSIYLGEIGADYYGTSMIGAQKMNGTLEIYGHATWKNAEGTHHDVYQFVHIANDKFVLDGVDGTFAPDVFSGDANDVLGLNGFKWKNTIMQAAIGAPGSVLDTAWMEWYDVNRSYDYGILDTTGFIGWYTRNEEWTEISLNAVDAWRDFQANQAAESSRLAGAEDAAAYVSGLVSSINSSAHVSLKEKQALVFDQTLRMRFATDNGTVLSIDYDTKGGLPKQIHLNAESATATDEWINIKDALISSGVGGVTASNFASLMGRPAANALSDTAGAVQMDVVNVNNWVFIMKWN